MLMVHPDLSENCTYLYFMIIRKTIIVAFIYQRLSMYIEMCRNKCTDTDSYNIEGCNADNLQNKQSV